MAPIQWQDGTKKLTHTAVKTAGLEPFRNARGRAQVEDVQREVRARIAKEMNNYSPKSGKMLFWLWLLTGFFGGHRFYMGKVITGIIFALTMGFGLIWWAIDLFLLRSMVQKYNREQARREAAGEPPIGMDFLPKVDESFEFGIPPWYRERLERQPGRVRFVTVFLADLAALSLFAIMLGAVSAGTNNYQPAIAAVVSIVVLLSIDKLLPYFHLPLVHEIILLDYKLRLFYYFNRPGGFFRLLLRPLVGIMIAPFLKKSRTEVKIYLEIAAVFTAFFLLWSLVSHLAKGTLFTQDILGNWIKSIFLNLSITYAFVSPVGATFTKHALIQKSGKRLWIMGGVTLFLLAIYSI